MRLVRREYGPHALKLFARLFIRLRNNDITIYNALNPACDKAENCVSKRQSNPYELA